MDIAGISIYKAEEGWKSDKLVEYNGFYGKGKSLEIAIENLKDNLFKEIEQFSKKLESLKVDFYYLDNIDFNMELAFYPETNLNND